MNTTTYVSDVSSDNQALCSGRWTEYGDKRAPHLFLRGTPWQDTLYHYGNFKGKRETLGYSKMFNDTKKREGKSRYLNPSETFEQAAQWFDALIADGPQCHAVQRYYTPEEDKERDARSAAKHKFETDCLDPSTCTSYQSVGSESDAIVLCMNMNRHITETCQYRGKMQRCSKVKWDAKAVEGPST